MSAEAYRITWALYVCGAIGLFIVFLRMTRDLRADWLRQPLRVLVAVWLLLPCPVDKGYSEWAPALLMFAFEGIFGGAEGAMRTGKPLLIMSGIALLVAALPLMWLNHYRRQGLQRQQEDMEATRVYRELVEDSNRHSDRYSDRHSDSYSDRYSDRQSERLTDPHPKNKRRHSTRR